MIIIHNCVCLATPQRDFDYEPSAASKRRSSGSGASSSLFNRRRTTEVRLGPENGIPPVAPNPRKQSTNA